MPITPKPSINARAIIQGNIPGQRRIFIVWDTRNATSLACTKIPGSLKLSNLSGSYISKYGGSGTYIFTATGPGGSATAVLSINQNNF